MFEISRKEVETPLTPALYVFEQQPYQPHIAGQWYVENEQGDIVAEGFKNRTDALAYIASFTD